MLPFIQMKINKGQFALSNVWKRIGFHVARGRGHLWRYLLNRARWHYGPRLKHTGRMPDHVDLELSSACNMRCPMCYTITEEFKEKVGLLMMDSALFKELIDQCAAHGVYSVRLSLRGEPTIHPQFLELALYAKARIHEVSMLTNGLKLPPATFEELVKVQFDWITISFDGLGETYEKIRKPAKYKEMVAKIQEFKAIKERHRSRKPVVKIQCVWPAIKDNPQAFYDVFEPFVDLISANPLIDYHHNDSPAAIEYEPRFTCPVLWQRLVVGSDGRVLLCSNDELGKHILGDANKQTLHEIWNGEAMRKVRAIHLQHRGVAEIESCRECYLPRLTTPVLTKIDNRKIIVDNYVNRPQEIGR